jgi:calcineurin-like phosphoesterase family protein
MSGNTWVISDPHFSHANILNFESSPGVPLRPFKTVEEMNETMIRNWNNVVHPQDRVYLLGDVAFNARTFHEIIPRLMGRICLVPGNHEPTKIRKYADLFDDIRGYVVKKGFIMSHIPIHEGSLSRWQINIHGHTHANSVKNIRNGKELDTLDNRYVCVCVEQIGYTPKLLSKVLEEAGVE